MPRTAKSEKAFTLAELLVVVAIVGILTALALVSLGSARAKARDARRIVDLREIANALHLYNNDNNRFPDALDELVAGGYISVIPSDPMPVIPSFSEYRYNSTGCSIPNQLFVLKAILERDHVALNLDVDGNYCTENCTDGDRAYCVSQ